LSISQKTLVRTVVSDLLILVIGGIFLRIITGSFRYYTDFALLLALLDFMFALFAHLDEDKAFAQAWVLSMLLAIAAGILGHFFL
jgi:hypothetical protein